MSTRRSKRPIGTPPVSRVRRCAARPRRTGTVARDRRRRPGDRPPPGDSPRAPASAIARADSTPEPRVPRPRRVLVRRRRGRLPDASPADRSDDAIRAARRTTTGAPARTRRQTSASRSTARDQLVRRRGERDAQVAVVAAVHREARPGRQQQAARAHIHHECGAERRVELDPQRDSARARAAPATPAELARPARRERIATGRAGHASAVRRSRRTAGSRAVATACSNSGVPRSCAGPRRDEPAHEVGLARGSSRRAVPPHTVLPSDPMRTTTRADRRRRSRAGPARDRCRDRPSSRRAPARARPLPRAQDRRRSAARSSIVRSGSGSRASGTP